MSDQTILELKAPHLARRDVSLPPQDQGHRRRNLAGSKRSMQSFCFRDLISCYNSPGWVSANCLWGRSLTKLLSGGHPWTTI